MAHYHCSYGKCNKGKGSSAAASYDYITRARSYKSKPGLLCFESSNLPDWCEGRAREYWYQADRHERANSNVARKIEFALPAEVTDLELQKELVRDVIAKACNGDRLMWSYAIHTTATGNIHAHVMLSERVQDDVPRTPDLFFKRANKRRPKKGGARKTEFLKTRDFVLFIREQIADLINGVYRRLGIDASVDHRGYAARGILKIPQAHRGPQLSEMEDRGVESYVLADRREKIVEKQKHLLWDLEFERDGILADLQYLTAQLDAWDELLTETDDDFERLFGDVDAGKLASQHKKLETQNYDDEFERLFGDVDGGDTPQPKKSEPVELLADDDEFERLFGDGEPVQRPKSIEEQIADLEEPYRHETATQPEPPKCPEPATISKPQFTPAQLTDLKYQPDAVPAVAGYRYQGLVLGYGTSSVYIRAYNRVVSVPLVRNAERGLYRAVGKVMDVEIDDRGWPYLPDDDDQSLGY